MLLKETGPGLVYNPESNHRLFWIKSSFIIWPVIYVMEHDTCTIEAVHLSWWRLKDASRLCVKRVERRVAQDWLVLLVHLPRVHMFVCQMVWSCRTGWVDVATVVQLRSGLYNLQHFIEAMQWCWTPAEPVVQCHQSKHFKIKIFLIRMSHCN